MSAHDIEQAIFNVADALLVPVLIAALLALAAVVYEAGRLAMELWRRRDRNLRGLEIAVADARTKLGADDDTGAEEALLSATRSPRMRATLAEIYEHRRATDFDDVSNKALADFDYDSVKKLE